MFVGDVLGRTSPLLSRARECVFAGEDGESMVYGQERSH